MCPQWLNWEVAEPGLEHNQSDCKPLKHQHPPSPQPLLIWEPRDGAGKMEGPQGSVLGLILAAQDAQEIGEDVAFLPALPQPTA